MYIQFNFTFYLLLSNSDCIETARKTFSGCSRKMSIIVRFSTVFTFGGVYAILRQVRSHRQRPNKSLTSLVQNSKKPKLAYHNSVPAFLVCMQFCTEHVVLNRFHAVAKWNLYTC